MALPQYVTQVTDSAAGGAISSRDFGVGLGSGPGRVAVIAVSSYAEGGSQDVQSVNLGGIDAQSVAQLSWWKERTDLWYLVDPPAGGVTVTVSWGAGVVDACQTTVAVYSGVDPLTPIGVSGTASAGAAAARSVALTTVVPDALVVGVHTLAGVATTLAPVNGATERSEGVAGSALTAWFGDRPAASAGAVSLDATAAAAPLYGSSAALAINGASGGSVFAGSATFQALAGLSAFGVANFAGASAMNAAAHLGARAVAGLRGRAHFSGTLSMQAAPQVTLAPITTPGTRRMTADAMDRRSEAAAKGRGADIDACSRTASAQV